MFCFVLGSNGRCSETSHLLLTSLMHITLAVSFTRVSTLAALDIAVDPSDPLNVWCVALHTHTHLPECCLLVVQSLAADRQLSSICHTASEWLQGHRTGKHLSHQLSLRKALWWPAAEMGLCCQPVCRHARHHRIWLPCGRDA